jgi:hypothetical protein
MKEKNCRNVAVGLCSDFSIYFFFGIFRTELIDVGEKELNCNDMVTNRSERERRGRGGLSYHISCLFLFYYVFGFIKYGQNLKKKVCCVGDVVGLHF